MCVRVRACARECACVHVCACCEVGVRAPHLHVSRGLRRRLRLPQMGRCLPVVALETEEISEALGGERLPRRAVAAVEVIVVVPFPAMKAERAGWNLQYAWASKASVHQVDAVHGRCVSSETTPNFRELDKHF